MVFLSTCVQSLFTVVTPGQHLSFLGSLTVHSCNTPPTFSISVHFWVHSLFPFVTTRSTFAVSVSFWVHSLFTVVTPRPAFMVSVPPSGSLTVHSCNILHLPDLSTSGSHIVRSCNIQASIAVSNPVLRSLIVHSCNIQHLPDLSTSDSVCNIQHLPFSLSISGTLSVQTFSIKHLLCLSTSGSVTFQRCSIQHLLYLSTSGSVNVQTSIIQHLRHLFTYGSASVQTFSPKYETRSSIYRIYKHMVHSLLSYQHPSVHVSFQTWLTRSSGLSRTNTALSFRF